MKRKSKILLLKQLKCTADHCTIPIRAHEGKPLEINKKFIQQMRCCTQDQWQINYSPVQKIKEKGKTSFNFITTISQWSWVKNAQINSGSTQRNALTLLMAVNFALKKKKKKKERKERKERKIFFRRN